MDQPNVVAVVLAAGLGKRMKSERPKCLQKVGGLPMVVHVLRALNVAGATRMVVVIGAGGELVREALGDVCEYAWQREQLGTGHAALMAADVLMCHRGPVILACGDMPLIPAETYETLVSEYRRTGATCCVATAKADDPKGYGRVVRSADGSIERIVEERDATPEQRLIDEVNTGVYCVDGPTLFDVLPNLGRNTAQAEYYLTDIVPAIRAKGGAVLPVRFPNSRDFLGVNDLWQLAEAEASLRKRLMRNLALSGVIIRDPDTTYVGVDVEIEPGAEIEPCTTLSGVTRIGAGSRIGPYTIIDDSDIGSECLIFLSRLSQARVDDQVKIGPFANIRPGANIGKGAKVGNFVEVKNSTLHEGVAASHLTYLGDSEIGAKTNVGAGTITCNYDGFAKHRTTIGAGSFIGSNTTLVAPITLGEGSFVAAGSVITQDIPDDSLGIGRARQEVKEGWARRWREKKRQ